jgi:polar amino acid transport system substrate-binding protein
LALALASAAVGPASAAEPAAPPPLVVNTSYSPPYSSPEAEGILDRLLTEAFRRLGREVVFRMLPAERSFRDANAGVADGDVGRIRGVDAIYPNLVIVDEPIIESRDFVAFSVRHDFPSTSWETLLPYNLGMVQGWKIFETNTAGARSRSYAENTEDLFRMLKHDRIDLALSARLDGLAMARKIGLEGVRVLEPPLASMKMFLYLHNRHAALAPAAAEALAAMKADGSFREIRQSAIQRWLSAQ